MAVHQQPQQFGCGYVADFVTATRADYGASEFVADCLRPELVGVDTSDNVPAARTPGVAIKDSDEFVYSSQPIKTDCSVCVNCEVPILDRTIVNVDGRAWHEQCLTCASCSINLSNETSCFFRQSNIFCKQCYNRQFGNKCSSCERLILPPDWVRKARSYVFHLACFVCDQCKRQLSTGEEFALHEGRLLCKQHFVELVEGESGIGQQKQKTKRVRTTFAEEQLSVLQAHFQVDSNPDGADLERIANMTGLSKRVTQVWFQNSRARQKKYQGNRKGCASGEETEGSRRSSEGPLSPGQKSETSSDGLIYPTSVTTSAEEAMTESTAALTSLQFD